MTLTLAASRAQLEEALSRAEDDPEQAAVLLRSALALWRGPALADCREEGWALGAATRLEEMKLTATELLIDARMACGEHAELCPELEHLVDRHPFREWLWGQLMVALYRCGRLTEALRVFQRLRRLLGEELGIEPSRELTELDAAVLRQDPVLDPTPRPSPPRGEWSPPANYGGPPKTAPPLPRTNIPHPLTSFVGRQRELAEVNERISAARLITLHGAGGVGKTRLATVVAAAQVSAMGGIFLVDLLGVGEEDVPLVVAATLEVSPPPATAPLDAVARAIASDNALLVLDSC